MDGKGDLDSLRSVYNGNALGIRKWVGGGGGGQVLTASQKGRYRKKHIVSIAKLVCGVESRGSSIKYVRTEGRKGVWALAYANVLVNGWRHKNCAQGGRGGRSKILKILRTYFMDGP